MQESESIKIVKGIVTINLASTDLNEDWIKSARLLKMGKTKELERLDRRKTKYFEQGR